MQAVNFLKSGEMRVKHQQELYHQYALAAEAYLRLPTIDNWEEKEKAFETYNASIRRIKEFA
ncbi:MAG: hypothetical protein ACHQJ6_02970 [Candidatus Berkiellales bacterium]